MTFTAQGATKQPTVESLGNNTYSITRKAASGFTRDTEKLKQEALDEAAAYCASHQKELKVISATTSKPKLMFTGYATANVVFKALDAGDPELRAPVMALMTTTPNGAALAPQAPGVIPPSSATVEMTTSPAGSSTDALYSDLMKLDELRKRGILTEEEFQAQKKKILERAN